MQTCIQTLLISGILFSFRLIFVILLRCFHFFSLSHWNSDGDFPLSIHKNRSSSHAKLFEQYLKLSFRSCLVVPQACKDGGSQKNTDIRDGGLITLSQQEAFLREPIKMLQGLIKTFILENTPNVTISAQRLRNWLLFVAKFYQNSASLLHLSLSHLDFSLKTTSLASIILEHQPLN